MAGNLSQDVGYFSFQSRGSIFLELLTRQFILTVSFKGSYQQPSFALQNIAYGKIKEHKADYKENKILGIWMQIRYNEKLE